MFSIVSNFPSIYDHRAGLQTIILLGRTDVRSKQKVVRHLLKEYQMVFRAGLHDPCTRYVARLSESVKILEPQASVFLRFPKVDQVHGSRNLLGKPFGNCFIK
jgi:hypothetical protein